MIVVSDSTPLISLALVNQLELLHELYGKVLIPQAVYVEVVDQGGYRAGAVEVARASWLSMEVVSIDSLNRVTPRSSQLHQGEIEAIALALQLKADVVLMDEQLARKLAMRLGLKVIGTFGILREAYQQGLLQDLRSTLDALRAKGVRISDALYQYLRQFSEKHESALYVAVSSVIKLLYIVGLTPS